MLSSDNDSRKASVHLSNLHAIPVMSKKLVTPHETKRTGIPEHGEVEGSISETWECSIRICEEETGMRHAMHVFEYALQRHKETRPHI